MRTPPDATTGRVTQHGSMTVLVTAASKHDSTWEMGEMLTLHLSARGFATECHRPQDVEDVSAYDAVIIGSGVYAGRWLKPAREFAERHAQALRERPVWLLSSGPVGPDLRPAEEPVDVAALMEATGARGHHVLPGNLDREKLGFGERAVVRALKVPYGDMRDWPALELLADDLAGQLRELLGAPA